MKTRNRIALAPALIALAASAAPAQETRGMIFGHVLDASSAAVAGAKVAVVNAATNQSTPLVTNDTGYYEANLLIAGSYRVSVEAAGFKTAVRSGIELPVSSRLQIDFKLEVGALSESVSVTAEAPLLDTNTMSSGRAVDNRSIMDLPIPGGNTVLLGKLAPGVQTVDSLSDRTVRLHSNGAGSRYNTSGGVGGNEYSIDGTPNSGNSRNIAYMPAPEIVQEFKMETSGFDATMGHSTGINVAMMTKTGTNSLHGNLRETHHQTLWEALPFFTKQAYYRRIAAAEAAGDKALADQIRSQPGQVPGRENNFAATIGGPVVLPKIYNGKDRLFFFFGIAGFRVGQYRQSYNTVPTMADRAGDFSPLLRVDPVRYQVYDPLTVRPDPSRATHVVRDPLPGNRLPASRIVSPLHKFYNNLLPEPNNDPADPRLEPSRNYIAYSSPYRESYDSYANRIDYRLSDRHRFFVRWSWNQWKNRDANWPYASKSPDILAYGQILNNVGISADWTYAVTPATLLDVAFANNIYRNQNYLDGAQQYKPSDVGLPAYMDAKAGGLHVLPSLSWSGYTGLAPNNFQDVARYRFLSAKADLSHVRGSHTLRAGFDARGQFLTNRNVGNTSGSFGFGNTWTRREDDSFTPAGSYGHSWAAFMMGLPDSLSVATNDDRAVSNPYLAWYAQDNWRVSPRLTINAGLRIEYEMGAIERYNRMIAYMDPNAALPITAGAVAAYAARPIPEVAPDKFVVKGGSLYAGAGSTPRELWKNALMWLPRASAAYQLGSRTVLRGGYGLFYDTLNVLNEGIDQTGFSRTTSSTVSTDFGQRWLLGDPKNGISPLVDPFPVRADGTRFDAPPRDALGLMAKVGRGWTYNPYDRKHARQQRWRASLQRQLGAAMVVEAAYAGSYSDQVNINRSLSPLPGNYWSTGTVRNDANANYLNANVTNPFYIGNFSGLRNSQPLIYADMNTNSFFTSQTIRRNQLIRAFPHMNGLNQGVPEGKVRTDSLELSLERRFTAGLAANVAYTRFRNRTADFFANEFDPAPTWRPSNTGRPHRLTASTIYELPFGKDRRFLQSGRWSHLAGGFQLSFIYEYQTGALLDWGNLFFYGDLKDIGTGPRTLDRWFNTGAGFERVSSKTPAAFHVRVFPARIEGIRGDRLNNWNGSAQRSIRITERWHLQLRFDVMNLQNRSQFDAPNTTPTSTDFGRVTSQPGLTGSGGGALNRWFQIQARLTF